MKVLANIHFVDTPIPESKNHRQSQPKLPLTKDNNRSFIIFPTKKLINNILKTFYVLHVEPDPSFISSKKFEQNAHAQKCLEATLKNKIDEFQTFGCYCKTINVGNSSINVYYTQKIDLFDNEMNPIKVKALLLKEKTEKALKQKLSENENEINIDTVFKCKTGGIKKLICGIHDGIEAKMIQMDLKEMDIGHVAKEVKTQLGTMKKNLHDIIQIYLTNNNLKGKAVRIRYENQWMFEEINLQNLLLSYNRL
uniref:Uncharacterized protein n=1 Tax=Panagrolaimus davidi TaxID=227884 RepID=A0A914QR08_9BILA